MVLLFIPKDYFTEQPETKIVKTMTQCFGNTLQNKKLLGEILTEIETEFKNQFLTLVQEETPVL